MKDYRRTAFGIQRNPFEMLQMLGHVDIGHFVADLFV